MRRTDFLEKTLLLGGTGGRRRRDDRGWDGWMASLTWWTWIWAISGSWWWTRKPGMLQSMGWQRVRHEWATELNWILKQQYKCHYCILKAFTINRKNNRLKFKSNFKFHNCISKHNLSFSWQVNILKSYFLFLIY